MRLSSAVRNILAYVYGACSVVAFRLAPSAHPEWVLMVCGLAFGAFAFLLLSLGHDAHRRPR